MNASDAQKLLVALLSRGKTSGGRASLITGFWGCGKTYLWKKLVAPQTQRPTVYVSAFGATSADDLKSRLLTQFLLGIVSRKGATSREKPTLSERASMFFGRPGKALIAALNSAGGAALQRVRLDPLELAELLDEKTIVCIDDIERTSAVFNVGDLLGIANILTEHKGLDVVLICNEDHIAAGDPQRVGPYFSYKEKAIFSECHLSADMSEMFERVLTSSTNSNEARQFARDGKDTILSVFRRAEVVNLRLLSRVFARIEVVFSSGVRVVSPKQLKFLAALTLYSAERQLPPRDFFSFNEFALRVSERIDRKPGAPSAHETQLAFIDAYFGEDEYEFDEGIFKLVRLGEVDVEHFKRAAAPPADLSPGEKAIKAAVDGAWRAFLDEDARKLVSEVLDAVTNDPRLSPAQLYAGLAYARYLAKILEMNLDPAREQAAIEAILDRARKGGDAVDSTWSIGLADSLGDAIGSELELYSAERSRARRQALALELRALIDAGDDSGLLKMMPGNRLEPLQVLCEEIGLEQLIGKREGFPWFFVVTMQGVLKELGQYAGIWPDGLKYRQQASEQLKRIANDKSEKLMTRWRASRLVPQETSG